jgi:sugar/nucleoside kinase (ribokinase family)
MGLSAAILTSHADDFPLDALPPQIEVMSVPAEATTRFEHRGDGGERRMRVTARARPLGVPAVPEDWREAGIAMLTPVLDEVDPLIATAFGAGSVGAAVQGYVRGLGRAGAIVPTAWDSPDLVLDWAQAVFLSAEDVAGDLTAVVEWFQRVPIGVLTAGRDGAVLFVNGERYAVRPHRVREVDGTGAGDVFAAAFMVHYHRHGDPWRAGAVAACAAALSVEGEGWSAVPDPATLAAALALYDRGE